MLSKRERKILQILNNQKNYITINMIAEEIHFSPKTVRNDLIEIKEFVLQNQLGEIIAKPKNGVKLITTNEKWDKLQSILSNDDSMIPWGVPLEKRKYEICRILLQKSKVNMAEIERQLYIGRSGAEKALEEAEKWLNGKNIKVCKIRGKGLQVVCTEFSRRLAFLELFFALNKVNRKSAFFRESDPRLLSEFSFYLKGFNISDVIRSVDETEKKYGFHLEYNSRQQLFFLIPFVLFHNRADSILDDQFLLNQSPFNRRIAEDLAARLENKYHTVIPQNEKKYLVFCVSISEIQKFTDSAGCLACENNELEFFDFVKRFIGLISEIMDINLKSDDILELNLFLYLRSAVERLRYGIHLSNPFLPKVKIEYPNIFAIVWAASVLIENDMEVEISENEIGFLTIYMIGAVERANSKVKASVLCNYGAGVSQLLKQKIERFIPNILVSDIVSVQDSEKVRNNDCDFVIASEDFGATFGGKDTVIVDNFIVPYDVKEIEKKILEIQRQKMNRIAKEDAFWHIKLFDSAFVQFLNQPCDKKSLLSGMCAQLEKRGFVSKGFLDSVLDRERVASTGIGKQVAIPHGSTKFIVRPIISVAILKEPILWNDNEWVDLIFLLALKPDGALHMKSQIMKFYSVLSTVFDDEKSLNYAKSIGNPKEFADYMNRLTE